jgi:hypothetical protein
MRIVALMGVLLGLWIAPAAQALNAQSFAQVVNGRMARPAATAAQVQAGFVPAILSNWSNPATAAPLIEALMQNPYQTYLVQYLFGQTATEAQYVQWDDEIAAAIGAYGLLAFEEIGASEADAGAYDKMLARSKAYPSPTIWMTMEEIYLEFATATSTTLSTGASVAFAVGYAGWWLDASFWTGYGMGTAFNDLIEEWDPDFDYDLAAAIVEQFQLEEINLELQWFALQSLYNYLVSTLGVPYPILP